jgi:spore maturation protein SpmB
MVTVNTFKRGLTNGIKTLLDLMKILVPVYIGVQILSISGILNIIAGIFEPILSVFGLPGETSLVMILGWFSGTYAALGALAAIELTGMQMTTIAIMLSIAHNLITEGAVVKKLGVSTSASVSLRLLFSLIMGFLFYRIFG